MDWSNERYVRLYTRDDADYALLSFNARAVWHELYRKADRSGVIQCSRGAEGIAALIRASRETVETALVELLEDGRLAYRADDGGYVIPAYLEMNEVRTSDRQRQADSRERRHSKAVGEHTNASHPVTRGHTPSHSVTPSLAVPSRAYPNQEENTAPSAPSVAPSAQRSRGLKKPAKPKPPTQPTEQEDAIARSVIQKLAKESGIAYRCGHLHIKLITQRLREGRDEQDLRKIIVYCAHKLGWRDKENMQPFLRPETLFGPQNIEKYIDAARTWWDREQPAPAIAKPPPAAQLDLEGQEPTWWGNSEGAA